MNDRILNFASSYNQPLVPWFVSDEEFRQNADELDLEIFDSGDKFVHPELQPGEKYMGNTTAQEFTNFSYKTKRLGQIAYDINGKLINQSSFA